MVRNTKILIILLMVATIFTSAVVVFLLRGEFIEEVYGPYEITIERNYNNESEEEMISIAENITPPDGLWWFMDFDNIRIADCVNNDAIKYYSDLINEIEIDHDFTGFDIKNAYFKYNATIAYIANTGNFNTSDQYLIKVILSISYHEYVNPI